MGLKDILARMDNLEEKLPEDEKKLLESIQAKRNRIEHHTYDEQADDKKTIAATLKFILFFVELFLEENLREDIDPKTLRGIQNIVHDFNDRYSLAEHRIETWMKQQWPEWDPRQEDTPEDFEGTLRCPECREDYLVIEEIPEPFCFWCNTKIDVRFYEDSEEIVPVFQPHDFED